tara:strand:- start:9547 stop:9810 length:264 start_codon:yes stop_codon:yes gene_type:complete
MTVKELMEITGETRFNLVKIFLRDCLTEIQLITNENIAQYTTDLVNGQSSYDLPKNLLQVGDVKIYNDKTELYEPVERVVPYNYKEK